MKEPLIAVTQRVDVSNPRSERRDALDQRWTKFLYECGISPLLLPNHEAVAKELLSSIPVTGILLTGGNDLSSYGGDAPERDAVESFCIQYCEEKRLPLLGICRGMQALQDFYGVKLEKVLNHVKPKMEISIRNKRDNVNSYHLWGTTKSVDLLNVWAVADDGVIKAVEHKSLPLKGVMWHPERAEPFSPRDEALFKSFFGTSK